MRYAHTTRRQAEASLEGWPDDDVSAVQAAAVAVGDLLELDGSDWSGESLELELTAAEQAAMHDFLHGYTDATRAHRARRRTCRALVADNYLIGGMSGAGKPRSVRGTEAA